MVFEDPGDGQVQLPLLQISNSPLTDKAVNVLECRDDALGSLPGSGKLESLFVNKCLAVRAREKIVQAKQTACIHLKQQCNL